MHTVDNNSGGGGGLTPAIKKLLLGVCCILLGQNLKIHHLGFYKILINKFFWKSARGAGSYVIPSLTPLCTSMFETSMPIYLSCITQQTWRDWKLFLSIINWLCLLYFGLLVWKNLECQCSIRERYGVCKPPSAFQDWNILPVKIIRHILVLKKVMRGS